MADPIYKPGDHVSVERWDKTERHVNKIGSPAVVLSVSTGERCESGVMVTFRGTSGAVRTLDQNWLLPAKLQHRSFEI